MTQSDEVQGNLGEIHVLHHSQAESRMAANGCSVPPGASVPATTGRPMMTVILQWGKIPPTISMVTDGSP